MFFNNFKIYLDKQISNINSRFPKSIKYGLFFISAIILVLIFPKELKFKYDYKKNKPWMHQDLIALYDFSIYKSDDELKKDKDNALKELIPYYKLDTQITETKRTELLEMTQEYVKMGKPFQMSGEERKFLINVFDNIINKGIIQQYKNENEKFNDKKIKLLIKNRAEIKPIDYFFTIKTADIYLKNILSKKFKEPKLNQFTSILESFLIQNLIYDAKTTEKDKQLILNNISETKGFIQKGERIISKGELINNEKFNILNSLQKEYEINLTTKWSYLSVFVGQFIIIFIILLILILFLYSFRKPIFYNNKQIALILLIIITNIAITIIVTQKAVEYLYVLPICIVPILIKVFFDTRVAIFIHFISCLIIGFVVPNSFEFVFIQTLAGIVSILSLINLENRAQFFLSSLLIFLTYTAISLSLLLIQDGSLKNIDIQTIIKFLYSSGLTLLSYPLIFILERIFKQITVITLLELSNTNNKLIRLLATKAPGTFHHSIILSNIAEEVVRRVRGNTLLVRAGAYYHDIGKSKNPEYFIENQKNNFNPHNNLTPFESAKIIINHVDEGIRIAEKYNIPRQIIEFIQSHHGNRKVEYFFNKQITEFPNLNFDINDFRYKGPIPKNKEIAILMMADVFEAAIRSLKHQTEDNINETIDNLFEKLITENQLNNSDITLKELQIIKSTFKKIFQNMYHNRIEYNKKSTNLIA